MRYRRFPQTGSHHSGTLALLFLGGFFSAAWSSGLPGAPQPEGLLGHYKFNGDGRDACDVGGAFDLRNVEFHKGTLYLNGYYENDLSSPGYRAVVDVPELTYEAFTISLEFNPICCESREWHFINRWTRARTRTENIITGGTSYRWFGLAAAQSKDLEFFFNSGEYAHTFPHAPVRERAWNRVVCCVDLQNLIVRTFFNGVKLEDVHLPSGFTLRVKPSNQDEKLTFANYSSGSTFYGHVDNLKVWGRALSDEEVLRLTFDHPLEQQQSRASWPRDMALALCALLLALSSYLYYRRRRRRRPVISP